MKKGDQLKEKQERNVFSGIAMTGFIGTSIFDMDIKSRFNGTRQYQTKPNHLEVIPFKLDDSKIIAKE